MSSRHANRQAGNGPNLQNNKFGNLRPPSGRNLNGTP